MEATQSRGANGDAGTERLVVVRTEDGFRVYSPGNPARSYTVSGSLEDLECTCSDFKNFTRYPCAHMEAVLNTFGHGNGAQEEDRHAREERAAIQSEGRTTAATERQSTPAQMLLKRSVSPDGRIDSLSVEFSTEVDESAAAAVADRAARLLALQSSIVRGFLDSAKNGNGARPEAEHDNGADGAVLAEMVGIGGMNGKWGRRLFISFQANGQSLRLYGNRSQLADAIRNAGFPRIAERIEEGVALRVPCRVITKPSPDGKYVNIERVLPVQTPESNRRAGR
jgi:SWIM zinc finger